MNKKYILIAALSAMTLGSCDMDKLPYDSLPDTEALNTPINFQAAAVGLYSGMQTSIMGVFYNAPEVQCDGFHAVTGFTNSLGEMYRWTFNSQTPEFETVYGNYQALIARSNFIIDAYNKVDLTNENIFPERATNDNPGLPAVKKAVGEAYFTRAYSIFQLSQYFCAAYDPATANNENTGVSYRLDYAPSYDQSTYPGRNTLAQTYEQIYKDLDAAAEHITLRGAKNNMYISIDAITALRARVALAQGNYELAKDEAEILINSGAYTLARGENALNQLWKTSSSWNEGGGGSETIFLLVTASPSELPLQTGNRYQPNQTGAIPDYIPTQALMDLYDANDYRKNVYFNQVDIETTTGGAGTVYAMNKYERDGVLFLLSQSESGRFCIEPRVFRIAEMYLIAAEAYANLEDEDGLRRAEELLNKLQRFRFKNFRNKSYADKDAFMAELKKERQRELLVEGFRLFDIKRWHDPMQRGEAQQRDLCLLPGSGTTDLSIPADDNRLTWPIPKHEIDVNPKVKQNPGY